MTTLFWYDRIAPILSFHNTDQEDATMLRRTPSQNKMSPESTNKPDTLPCVSPIVEEDEDANDQERQWGWFVPEEDQGRTAANRLLPTQPIPPIHDTSNNPATPSSHPQRPIITANVSLTEFLLIECLLYCHPTLQQSVLSLTGLSQKCELPTKKTAPKAGNNIEPSTYQMRL